MKKLVTLHNDGGFSFMRDLDYPLTFLADVRTVVDIIRISSKSLHEAGVRAKHLTSPTIIYWSFFEGIEASIVEVEIPPSNKCEQVALNGIKVYRNWNGITYVVHHAAKKAYAFNDETHYYFIKLLKKAVACKLKPEMGIASNVYKLFINGLQSKSNQIFPTWAK